MSWLDKLERRYGNKGIPNLMQWLVGGQLLLYVATLLLNRYELLGLLGLSRAGLLHGQVWRLFTFVFLPTSWGNPLLVFISLYFYYFLGNALENAWGTFRFNVFLACNMVGAWLACLITGSATSMGLYYSIFFAFACLFPDMQVMLFFILPIKVKWMGLFSGALYLIEFLLAGSWAARASMALCLAGFFLFFGKGLWHTGFQSWRNYKRRKEWQNQWKNR